MTLAPPAPDVPDAAGLVAELRATFNRGRTRPLGWRRRQLEGLRRLLSEAEPELLAALATDLGSRRWKGG